MPVFKPRNRLVNFRLSEDEFERLRASCALSGARSLSDFARDSVMRSVTAEAQARPQPPAASAPSEAAPAIDRKVHELESRVTELMQLMHALRGEVSPTPDPVPSPSTRPALE